MYHDRMIIVFGLSVKLLSSKFTVLFYFIEPEIPTHATNSEQIISAKIFRKNTHAFMEMDRTTDE